MYFERKNADGGHLPGSGNRRSQLGSNTLHSECLDYVADLNVVEVHERDTAFETVLDLAGIVLEALESFDFAGVNEFAIALNTNLAVAAHGAIGHVATGNDTDFADLEDLANVGMTLDRFFVDRIEQTGHGQSDFVDQFVDDAVKADVYFLAVQRLNRRYARFLR